MTAVCFYFQVHQPYRLRSYRMFDIGRRHDYFDRDENKRIMRRVADQCYLPANEVLQALLNRFPEFRCSFSVTSTALDQMVEYAPEALSSFQKLAVSGRVEFLVETAYHSLASEISADEFRKQVAHHHERIQSTFGVSPRVFRNTELIFHDRLAELVAACGYEGIMAEGAERLLAGRSPNYVYRTDSRSDLKLLLRNYRLSDDIAFRFGQSSWCEFPLTAPKFAGWLANSPGEVINLFMDYETFGEHQWADSGIFDFLRHLPEEIGRHAHLRFATPSEVLAGCASCDVLSMPDPLSWADTERDLSAWLGNRMQTEACRRLYEMGHRICELGDEVLLRDWRRLQTSDHFYYMSTKTLDDGAVHRYFSPYSSPYDAFVAYNNVMTDLHGRVAALEQATSGSGDAD